MRHQVLAAATATLVIGAQSVNAHVSIWDPSMWGFNVTHQQGYDNRPVTPLINLPFQKWWFHGHLDYPPHKEDVYELKAGQTAHFEIACDKGFTAYYNSSDGGDIRVPSDPSPCPGSPTTQFHTPSPDHAQGCALAIVDKSDASQVQPEDFAIFSVNQSCVWNRNTDFQVPAKMPACTGSSCICAWFWIHDPDSGAEQMYMTAFQCRVSGAQPNAPKIMKPSLARRCGEDKPNNKPADPKNCTVGAKQPLYWLQAERSNMFEGYYSPPYYNDLYDFKDGAQNDIFEGSAPAAAPASKRSAVEKIRDALSGAKENGVNGLYQKHQKRRTATQL